MRLVRSVGCCVGALLAAMAGLSMLATSGFAYTQEQQQACTPDAFRLCGSDVPDVDRVTLCMIRNRSQLSAECRAHFRPEPEAMPVAARGPINIRPPKPRARVVARPVGAKPVGSKPRKPGKPGRGAKT
jgi:hypothetical protein